MELRPLGRLCRLQIQPVSLKTGDSPHRRYEPGRLLATEELWLSTEGAAARGPDGAWILDIHHARHPATRNNDNVNPLSIGFTAHYDQLQADYGAHLWLGSGGETLIVENEARIRLEHVAQGLAIQPQGGDALYWLRQVSIAHPCRPFSGYVLGGTEASVKEALQALDGGLRGFYCVLDSEQPVRVRRGDQVLALQP